MTAWEKKIVDALIDHYFSAAPAAGIGSCDRDSPPAPAAEVMPIPGDRRVLRLRSSVFFPDFDSANSDEKDSYLEAAESLQRKGVIKLNWEKRNKGERLKTLSCDNIEKLFEESGRPFPKTEAEEIRAMLGKKADALKKSLVVSPDRTAGVKNIIALLEFLSIHFGSREIGQGINRSAMEDLVKLVEFLSRPSGQDKITTRALSILLYRDSKRLENLLSLCKPLFLLAAKFFPAPDFSFLERSYPETMICGKISIEYKNGRTPLVNHEGHILGLPLEHAVEISGIQLISKKNEKTVLTIENKETFYALGSLQKTVPCGPEAPLVYDCYLYIGGYSNRATAALVKVLATSGFSFFHAGDLDPDGILILQQIMDVAGKPVTPVRMDAAAFDQYKTWAKTLAKPALRQMKKIREDTKAIPGLADLLQRIGETGLGIEQEIIDYR